MAGSLRWFVYTDDDGEKWAVNRDESNVEAVHSSPTSWGGTGGNSPKYTLPGNLEPRKAKFKGDDGRVSYVIVLDTATADALTAAKTITVSGQTRKFAGMVSQKWKQTPFAGDSGANDGDGDADTNQ